MLILRSLAVLPIILYQKTFSPDHGLLRVFFPHGACRFFPTCSEYTRLSIMQFGIFYGYEKGFRRILRCHPWSDGGVDQP